MKNTFLKLWNNIYLRHILFALAAIVLILIISSILLDQITRHGVSKPLPDFTGKTLDSALAIAKANNWRIEVTDSVFRKDFPKGAVWKQNPDSGSYVKKNRKIFLTVNSLSQKKEVLPKVVGLSLRQAKAVLTAKGFRVGQLIYDSKDYATNNVLQQLYMKHNIEPGVMLPVGEYIDLRLGLDTVNVTAISVPNVMGAVKQSAEDIIIENSLNYKCIFDPNIKTVTDSLNSTVYKQEPEANATSYYGHTVTVWLKRQKIKTKQN
ncbi:MAG: PASTA domain-containing protein [Prevotellaceae bacterium]|jgi:hypothetical protein|nr:PASTA domain-containing protein [Prevotellaceae bacterium]